MAAEVLGPDALLRDSEFAALKRYLIERTGLSYYEDKERDLASLVVGRMAKVGLSDCAGYLSRIQGGEAELRTIVNRLTIGETYFFRHSEQFDAIRDAALPELLAPDRPQRKLRIWSAGCANGAEVYSLSILLRRDLAHLAAGWDIRILGTDINDEFLAQAREGIFGEWAMRTVPAEIRDHCFYRRGKHWEIAKPFREGVSFEHHNLATDLDAPIAEPHLILCRNVMIYFRPEFIRDLLDRFYQWLPGDGWLVAGHAEAHLGCFTRFEVVNAPGATLYRKRASAPAATVSAQAWTAPQLPPAVPELPAEAPAVTEPERTPEWTEVEALLRGGDAVGARAACELLLRLHALDPRGHVLYAVALEKSGSPEEAEKALGRAIYLNRSSVGAHYRLGLLLERRGERRRAARSFETVCRLLARLEPDSQPVEAMSLTAQALLETVKRKMEALEAA